jgi:hypothetical protein
MINKRMKMLSKVVFVVLLLLLTSIVVEWLMHGNPLDSPSRRTALISIFLGIGGVTLGILGFGRRSKRK